MVKGVSIHSEILKMINQGIQYGKVHSVFNKTINLLTENEWMISLVTKNIDEAPFSILVDTEDFKKWQIAIGENVLLNEKKVALNATSIDISRARSYDLKRGIFNDNGSLIKENLEVVRRIITSKGPEEKYKFESKALEMVVHRTTLLRKACLEENNEEIIRSCRSLLGLGQGLTPSGDDVMMGLFLVLGLENSPMKHLDFLLGKVIENRMEDTTDVSYHGLLRASEGYYRSILVKAVEAMAKEVSIEEIVMDVLSIGHSSGRDLLYGILTGYEILMEKENDNVN